MAGEHLSDGKTEAGVAFVAVGAVGAVETFEDVRLVFRGDARAVVADAEGEAFGACTGDEADVGARRGMAGGIVEEDG